MTTKAQIEAAKKAFWETWPSFQEWWLSIEDTYGGKMTFEVMPEEPIEAALTAAAEVCPYCGERAIMGAFECRCTGIAAAAEVDEKQRCNHWPGQKRCEVCGMGITAAAEADPAMRDFIKDTPISEPNDGLAAEVGGQKTCPHCGKQL